MYKIAIIGSGFSGISAAAYLSKMGYEVHIFEKNDQLGGRASIIKTEKGYIFDKGPSWYWMPDVFEQFFTDFGANITDYYDLKLLNPSFEIYYGENDKLSVPENFESLCDLFESIEVGSSLKLKKFLSDAAYKYKVGMQDLIYKPCDSIFEFCNLKTLKGIFTTQIFTSFSKEVRSYFKNPKLIALMEFPVLFLGAMPQETPALYSLMNYAGLKLGTWYPMGGFSKVVDGMVAIAKKNGTHFHTNSSISKINSIGDQVNSIIVNGEEQKFDIVVGSADYHHIEEKLLDKEVKNYDSEYWETKTFAPSCLIFYIGVNKKIENLQHHTLFFDEDLYQHSIEIYKNPTWPSKPLFYVCCPSVTDNSVAPDGHENLFFLMPLAPNVVDNEQNREKYFDVMINRFEKLVGTTIKENIDYKQSYCVNDFKQDYNSYKGNAYGLANTLMQTAILKPKLRNKKLKNLFYAGQLTVPGPGVPPALISGKIVSNLISQQFKMN